MGKLKIEIETPTRAALEYIMNAVIEALKRENVVSVNVVKEFD
jgi:hypothetical protein